jgi:hypothetical protein
MFTEENTFLDSRAFNRRVSERVETIIATVESEIFDIHYADFCECRFGVLVPNFGMFYPDHGDGEHCYAQRFRPLEGGKCPISCGGCALVSPMKVTDENKECVILNYALHNGKILRTGEVDVRGEINETSALVFLVPFHKIYGTEFKIFLDVPDEATGEELIEMFLSIGIRANMSDNVGSKRLYVSLPERRSQGMFRLDHEFNNNFLCVKAGKSRV